jgi:hypothetical protein
MPVIAAVALEARGRLLGGEEGEDLVTASHAWLRDRGFAEPAVTCATYAPGLRDAGSS